MKRAIIIRDPATRLRAHQAIDEAPEGYQVTISDQTRTSPENRLLHALIGEIAETVPWAGKKRDAETWKRLLVASWCRVQGEQIEILPALDGHGVDIVPQRTSKLTKSECADLIEFVHCWAAENGVRFAAQEACA